MKQLQKKLLKGDNAAFVELYDLLGDKLFRYVNSKLNSNSDTADVVQEIFIRLVNSHRQLGRCDNLTSYIFAIARNEAFRWLKKKKSQSTEPLSENLSTAHHQESVDGNDWVHKTLSRLADTDQEIVYLKIFTKLTFKEIAAVIDMNNDTVATRYRRSIEKLQGYLQDLNPDQANKQSFDSTTKAEEL